MNESIFFSIVATGFTVAFAHAALPTHWLPFVLAGRGQNWNKSKTLWVTALASLGHVLFTTMLGVLVVFLGIKVEGFLGGAFPLIVGGLLIAFGIFYLVRQGRGGGGHHHWQLPWMKKHGHSHAVHGHDDERRIDTGHGVVVLSVFEDGVPPRFRLNFEDHGRNINPPKGQTVTIETVRPNAKKQFFTFVNKGNYLESLEEVPEPHEFTARLTLAHGNHGHHYDVQYTEHDHGHDHSDHEDHTNCGEKPFVSGRSDKAVIIGLLALLTFSPCEGFLPVYLSGIQYGWPGFILLSTILALATMAGMIFFTWLTLAGLERIRLEVLEKYEAGILGALLIVLGFIVIIFEHS
jgi:ABC-type nickel/cobalt efflux system permease component RcnA